MVEEEKELGGDSLLPTAITVDPDAIEVPEIHNLGIKPPDTEVIKEDIAIATMQLQGLMAAWALPGLSVGRMLKLIDGTMKAVKMRRDVLGLPYGYINEGPKRVSFEPLD